jgi:3-oxoadipate enol-lactonase
MPMLNIFPGFDLFFLDLSPKSRPCVILLHGLGATSESWGYQIPTLLNHGYRVLAPDIRGFGKSSYPGRNHNIPDLAEDIITLMDHLQLPTAHLVGISMGGAIALQLACDHNTRFEKVVLVNTFARLRPNSLQAGIYFIIRFSIVHVVGLPAQAQFVAARLFPKSEQEFLRHAFIEQVLQSGPKAYRATMRALMRLSLNHRLPAIKNNVLVISGANDFTVPLSTQQDLARQIPNASHRIIYDAGHAVTVEKPAEINHLLIKFLSNSTTLE